MIRSREVGLFNAYSMAQAGVLTLSFWGCVFLLAVADFREFSFNWDSYLAYNLISIGGLLLQLYQTDSSRLNLQGLDSVSNLRLSVQQALHVAAALTVMLVLTKDLGISRLFFLVYLGVLVPAFFWSNSVIPRWLSRMFFAGASQLPTLLIGQPIQVGRMRRWLRRLGDYGFRVVGLLPEKKSDQNRTVQRIPIVGEARDLATILNRIRIETVIVLDIPQDQDLLDYLIDTTDRAGVRMIVMNNLSERFRHSVRFYRQFGLDFITLREEPLQDPLNRLIKRILDLIVAGAVTLFVLPPLVVFVWAIHRLQSPGPLFFRQTRAGIQNRRFDMIKFRTMHLFEGDPSRQAKREDERVFPLGRLLRRTSLDEIPQFLNVLFGDMSVVGPRPHMIEHNDQFAKVMANYHIRAFVKPGITGLAQVKGFRGEAHTDDDICKRVACDIDYIERWSAALDLLIIGKTFFQVFSPPKSAY